MLAAIHATVIPWEGILPPVLDVDIGPPAVCRDTSKDLFAAAENIDPFPWDGGRPQGCYDNVAYLVKLLGGELVYGWALADAGPQSAAQQTLSPLFARWINHAVWRDGGGKLWEVTPRFEIGNLARVGWVPTRFVPDAEAVFHCDEFHRWSQPARYTALRPEGERLAQLLRRAEVEADDHCRLRLLQAALAELASAGFAPKECRIEMCGTRTNNIWLIAK